MSDILTYQDFLGGRLNAGTTLRGRNFAQDMADAGGSIVRRLGFTGLAALKQVHSDQVHFIDSANIKKFLVNPLQDYPLIEGDGIFTDVRELLLGVLTADCIPVLYADAGLKVAGIVHAGWKGIKGKIHMKIVEKIKERLDIGPERLHVLIGPHIRKCCYNVGHELIEEFENVHYESRDGKIFLDLESGLIEDLIAVGILSDNIKKASLCTKCSKNPLFYSYRGGDNGKRMLSFIGLPEAL